MNEELGRLSIYAKHACVRCGRRAPGTTINFEAVIHHGAKEYLCVDRKSCEKIAKKRKRNG